MTRDELDKFTLKIQLILNDPDNRKRYKSEADSIISRADIAVRPALDYLLTKAVEVAL